MIDAGAVITGVIAGVISGKLSEGIDHVVQSNDYSHEEKIEILLGTLIQVSAPQEKENFNRSFALQPYPSEFAVNEDWHGKSHFCIFFHDQTPIRFDVEGVGTYLKTVGPGWVQCDVRGRISTTDAANHNVLISYRDDAIGESL